MISSTEVRKRINEAKQEAAAAKEEEEKTNEEIKSASAIQSASYFYKIGGLVSKSTIEYIRENNLYWVFKNERYTHSHLLFFDILK